MVAAIAASRDSQHATLPVAAPGAEPSGASAAVGAPAPSFTSTLARARVSGSETQGSDTPVSEPNHNAPKTRDAAVKLLSQLFFAPMLAEMRKDPFGAKFAKGGRTEEIFGEQLDTRIADAVAQSAVGLTDQIAAKLAGHRNGGHRSGGVE